MLHVGQILQEKKIGESENISNKYTKVRQQNTEEINGHSLMVLYTRLDKVA